MNTESVKDYLLALLGGQLPAAGRDWLQQQSAGLNSEKVFYLAFSRSPRFTGKQALTLSAGDLATAAALRPGFNPQNWTLDQAARTWLLLSVPHDSPEAYTAILNKVFSTADLHELATLYAALPLLPYPETHVKRAAEGVRSTMTEVFDAVALNNPYPHDYLPEEAWNQLVLKSVFNVRPLYRIYGLDARRNEPLAHMLLDYAHERWAAGRTLTPELWRMAGPYLKAENLPDIKRLLGQGEEIHHQAAALALAESQLPEAKEMLRTRPDLEKAVKNGTLTWQQIGENAY